MSELKDSQRSQCRSVILVFLQHWGRGDRRAPETQGTASLAYATNNTPCLNKVEGEGQQPKLSYDFHSLALASKLLHLLT